VIANKENKRMRHTLAAAAVLAALAVPAFAEEISYTYQPEPAFERMIVRVAEPMRAKDAFAGLEECAVVDARTFRPVTAAQAEALLKPCVTAVGRRYGKDVTLEKLAAAPEGSMSTQVEGLALYLPADVAVTEPLMRDVQFGLGRRGDRVLGHQVLVRRGLPAPSSNKPVTTPAALTRSVLQAAVDACPRTMVVRRIETSADFIAAYGGCILADKKLQVSLIRPAAAQPMGVLVQSDADAPVVRSLNGVVTIPAAGGPVMVSVAAFGAPQFVVQR
jgi:hypothetical protein